VSAFSRSGRWFRAPVPDDRITEVTAASAIGMLNTLEPRFSGGSYYDSNGFEALGRVNLSP
jgi:hypothetical protein